MGLALGGRPAYGAGQGVIGESWEAGRGGPREKDVEDPASREDEHERDGPCIVWGFMALDRSIKRSSADP
jgi:hypothetical protein